MLRLVKNYINTKQITETSGLSVSMPSDIFNKFTQGLTGYFRAKKDSTFDFEFTPGTFYNVDGDIIEFTTTLNVEKWYNQVVVYGYAPSTKYYCCLNVGRLSYDYYFRIEARTSKMLDKPHICTVYSDDQGEITMDMIESEVPNIILT